MSGDRGFESAEFGDNPPRRRRAQHPPPRRQDHEWWTLRSAAEATGIPVTTLRRWYRRGRVTGRLVQTPAGSRVQVLATDVLARAAERQGQPSPSRPSPTEPASSVPPPTDPASPPTPTPPPTQVSPPDAPAPAPAPAPEPGPTQADPTGQAVLVPVDTWQRILSQLGNLHEAGQQLAEARERAARAETEVTFLRQRLADLRTPETSPQPTPPPAPEPPPPPGPVPPPPSATRPSPVAGTAAGRAVDYAVTSLRRAWKARRHRRR